MERGAALGCSADRRLFCVRSAENSGHHRGRGGVLCRVVRLRNTNMKTPLFKRWSRHLRGRWRSKVLASHGVAVVADTKNGLLAVQTGDFNVSRTLLQKGEYHWQEIRLLRNLVDANSRLIFAGAHIGALLVPIVYAARMKAAVAYEPSPRNFQLLAMNLALNEIDIVMDIEGSEVAAMRGGQATLAKTRRFYVEFAPEQLREQGSTTEVFAALASRFFKSAYVVGKNMKFIRASDFSSHLLQASQQRGLLLNLLFTQDVDPALSWIGDIT